MFTESQFYSAYEEVRRFKEAGSLVHRGKVYPSALQVGDRDGKFLAPAIVEEVNELGRELNKPDSPENRQNSHGEGDDVLVFAICAHMLHGAGTDPLAQQHRVNGAGKRSNALDVLRELATDALDNSRYFPLFFAHLFSVIRYLPPIPMTWFESVLRTVDKAENNRNGYEFVFSRWDPFRGRLMTEDEMMADAKPHQEVALRLIRKKLHRTLTPEDYGEYSWYIFNWQNSAQVLEQLRLQLEQDIQTPAHTLPKPKKKIPIFSHLPSTIRHLHQPVRK